MLVLIISVLAIVIVLALVLVFKLHPFIALLLATLFLQVCVPLNSRLANTALELGIRPKSIDWDREQLVVGELLSETEYQVFDARRPIRSSSPMRVAMPPDTRKGSLVYEFEMEAAQASQLPSSADHLILLPQSKYAASRSAHVLTNLAADLTYGFAKTFRRLGIPVTMAAIIGLCLLRSGAASRIVQSIAGLFGERGTYPSLTLSSFVLGVPVYFDNVFYLLLPLARALGKQKPATYLTAVMAIIVGATMAHSLVPPTPGPLLVVELLAEQNVGVSIGSMMMGGLIVGGVAVTLGYVYGSLCSRFVSLEPPKMESTEEEGEVDAQQPLPSLWLSILPIAFPMIMLGGTEVFAAINGISKKELTGLLSFLGEPTFVFIAAALLAIWLLATCRLQVSVTQTVSKALSDSGTILLLTCAGGAFGAALQKIRLADAIAMQFEGVNSAWGLLATAFFLTVIIRAAQGSATVAMITSASIVAPLLPDMALPFHPVYIALAIGCGSKPLPWMNDSGFWQVATMTGMSSVQTLKTFSAALTIMGLVGFVTVCLGAWLLPLV